MSQNNARSELLFHNLPNPESAFCTSYEILNLLQSLMHDVFNYREYLSITEQKLKRHLFIYLFIYFWQNKHNSWQTNSL